MIPSKSLATSITGAITLLLLATTHTHAVSLSFTSTLSGAAEASPNASPATGSSIVTFDSDAQTLRVVVNFTGLLGTTTAAHIHAPTPTPGTGVAGVATQTPYFTGFPIGVTSGSYDHTFDLTDASTYNAAFVTANGGTPEGAAAALLSALTQGNSYLNVHSSVYPSGEIRGFLASPNVPEPSSILAACVALAMLILARRPAAAGPPLHVR